MARIGTKSRCLEDWAERHPSAFLPAEQAAALRSGLRSRFEKRDSYAWEQFDRPALSEEEALEAVSRWPGECVLVAFLDLTDPRIAVIEKSRVGEFFDEFVYPSEDTYFVSEDRSRLVCLDHHQKGHAAALTPS
jgi:hypothetical protein